MKGTAFGLASNGDMFAANFVRKSEIVTGYGLKHNVSLNNF